MSELGMHHMLRSSLPGPGEYLVLSTVTEISQSISCILLLAAASLGTPQTANLWVIESDRNRSD